MTANTVPFRKKAATGGFCLMTAFFILLLLKNPEIATECIGKGISICLKTVIPALFPFMILTELLLICGFADWFGRYLGGPIASLFGTNRQGAAAVFLGFVCGFPIGARMALGLYDRNIINKEECERLLGFCNIPSIAFLVSAVGTSLYHSKRFGILLWLCCMTSAALVGICTRKKEASKTKASPCTGPIIGTSSITSAVASASTAMISVCAYILFFGTILGCLSLVLDSFGAPSVSRVLLYGFFEMTSGVSAAATVDNRAASAVLCALATGWSGLSVHLQLMTLCDGRELSYRFYFFARLAQAIICAALVMVLLPVCF